MSSTVKPPASTKKRRFVPPSPILQLADAANLRLLHQDIQLSFCFQRSSSPNQWHCRGSTTLYVVDSTEASISTTETTAAATAIALHLRRTCQVEQLHIERVARVDGKVKLTIVPSSYQHLDPLAHVLTKSPQSYTEDDIGGTDARYAADSQCSRNATGLMTGLRVASMASHMGELRVTVQPPGRPKKLRLSGRSTPEEPEPKIEMTVTEEEAKECWKKAVQDYYNSTDGSDNDDDDATAVQDLQSQLMNRSITTRTNRVTFLSNLLGRVNKGAMRITIDYIIPVPVNDDVAHMGGIHTVGGNSTNSTPHIYTTTGTYGDHQGPRQWVPTLDSAFVHHRASRRFQILVTAPMQDGLSAVGCGEHLGVHHTYLHDMSTLEEDTPAATLLGKSHVAWLKKIVSAATSTSGDAAAHAVPSGPHVIPPDSPPAPNSIHSILATSIWCSDAWTPSPSRSLGFAVGPFKMLEDPEYFSIEEEEEEEAPAVETIPEEDEDEDEQSPLEKELEALEMARRNGEGIRQVYFAPLFERKKIFEKADMRLLPGADIALPSLTCSQIQQAEALDEAVTSATAGVPHRALSLLRDVLALPVYRTTSYTQIWIPNAVHGGSTSGALHCCPEVLVNPFLGGAILDSRMLPPPKNRLPYHGGGGRVLQFLQARCAVRGWITAALPLGGKDDVGYGYILSLIESFLMSLYERGHGAHGEGGSKGSVLFTKRFAVSSGLNSTNLDFLPVLNIEESDLDMFGGIVGAIPTEDRNNEHMFRTASNGSESHTSSLDEYNIRQLLMSDIVEALERGTDKDKNVPLPSFGWTGSHLGLSFLSSTASSSSELGCGAVELAHPVGGLLYRTVKVEALRRVTEGRAGIANLVRVIRAGFIAAHLGDVGEKKLRWEEQSQKKQKEGWDKKKDEETSSKPLIRPPFVICVDKLLSKGGFTHTLFISGLRILAGPIREAHLRGTLVDVERNVRNSTTNRQFVEPEGFPNSYVRGASMPYLRVGTHVEKAPDVGGPAGSSKGVQLHVLVEPSVPDGGIAFGGPVTLRVVENEGQLREFVKVLNNGARADWGPIFLHAKTVTTTKDQNAASGIIETSSSSKDKKDKGIKKGGDKSVLAAVQGGKVFNENILHNLGYQAIELVRLTNLTPLLWVRVDPQGLFGGKISIFQPDACLAEMLFHDGDASAQIEAVRALAERPIKIQGSVKIQVVHNVQISELPVRLLGDCLRGSPALHGDLPHTPGVRVQAALGIGQWQNNKAPSTKDSVDTEAWLGVNLLMQYFKERYYKSGIIMPVKFSRLAIKKSDVEARQSADSGAGKAKGREPDDYTYFDTLREEDERQAALEGAEDIEVEEDEEYRVRSSVIAAIACVRAKDGMTPAVVVKFMSTVLEAGDVSMVGTMDTQEAATIGARITTKKKGGKLDENKAAGLQQSPIGNLQYISSMVIADALLAVCSINSSPSVITDPATGKPVQSSFQHPVQSLLVASRRWLEWELYRETIRTEMDRENLSGIGGNCYDSVAACGVAALSTLAILRQATTVQIEGRIETQGSEEAMIGAQFYMNIFDEEPRRPDVTRAACAQAVACVCCAADRFESPTPPLGLLTALEYILQRIIDPTSSPGFRQTLSLVMLDTCTGKVSVRQRVGVIGARSDLCYTGARFYGGPLGTSNGNDNGSALLTSVNAISNPAADAVNDGARRGLRLLSRAGHPRDESTDEIVARVARLATDLWRTINGHRVQSSKNDLLDTAADGVCANDGILRCSLLSLWQWIWPKACYSIKKVQNWRSHEDTPRYKALGAAKVLKIYDEENEAAVAEEKSFEALNAIVNAEIDRQGWRGEMMVKAEEQHMMDKKNNNKDDQGLGDLLPPILRDPAFKQGGWVASTSTQRRVMALDGGSAYKIRASVSKAAV